MPHGYHLIDPYLLKRILIGIIYFMSASVVCLFVSVIVHKAYTESMENLINKIKATYIPMISRKLIDDSYELRRPARKVETEAVADILIDMLASISGDMEKQLKRLASGLGIVEHYRKMAGSKASTRRFVAMEKLGFLRLPELKPFYHEVLRTEGNSGVIARTVLALSLIADSEEDIRAINDVVKNPLFMSSKFTEYLYTNVIKSFRNHTLEDTFVGLLARIETAPDIPVLVKRDIIEACGSEALYQARGVIIHFFDTFRDLPEMKIACIRALGKLGGEEACVIIKSCLGDGDWRVRAVDAKNAHLCPDDIAARLAESLHDENYYVRINTAISLSRLGHAGIEMLQKASNSGDRFTRDVSQYILRDMEIRA